jgi:ArsR family transcriptional regulator
MARGIYDFLNIDIRRVERMRRALPRDALALKMAEAFKVLSDPTRLRIVSALGLEEMCVADISSLVALDPSLVSHHLRILRQLNIVRHRRDGKMIYYALSDEHIATLMAIAREHAEEVL